MVKRASKFVCTNCGAQTSTWAGRCYACGEWNTLEEEVVVDQTMIKGAAKQGSTLHVAHLSDAIKQPESRLKTQIPELDDVLGGGVVPGSVTLLAGQPGIGKSTILLQVAEAIAKHSKVLYVSGEESVHQISMRAERLKVTSNNIDIVASNSTNDIAATMTDKTYSLVIIDSIQTIKVDTVATSPGTVSQITNSTHVLTAVAKQTNSALVLVGHVTKEGSIAGPKILEHLVDTVLQLEGDRYGGFKVLRGVKNRFGSTNEVGIFEMTSTGLLPVANPSAALLAERQITDGSVVLATIEGSRAMLVEVQALVNKTSYGYPKRAASGIDLNRVTLLIAMLERRTKLQLADCDIYINIVGGMKITEPAADLAVCMAIASASKGMQLKKNAVVFGELGLSGEVRHVPLSEKRLQEAKKLGFDGAIGPVQRTGTKLTALHEVVDIKQALNTYLEKD